MNNRLVIVAITGLAVGTVVGGVWLSRDLPEVTPVVTVASRTEAPADSGARKTRAANERDLGAGAATRPKVRPDGDRAAASKAPARREKDPADAAEEELVRPALGDTGLPSPAAVLGLPAADVDDSQLVAGLADDYPPLPDRPLSNYEMETLEDRAAWLSQTCEGSSDASCSAAMENMDQALEQARSVRAAAGVDGEEDTPPPPMLPPPLEEQPPPPEKGPPLDENGEPLPPPEGHGPPPEGHGPPP